MEPLLADVARVHLILHELRSPLNVLAGSLTQLIEGRGGALNTEQLAIAERANRAASQLGRLGDQLREWVAVRSQPPRPGTTALAAALGAATELTEAHAGRGIRVQVTAPAADLHVHMAPTLLEATLGAVLDAVTRAAARGAVVPVTVRSDAAGPPAHPTRVLILAGDVDPLTPDAAFAAESTGGLGFALPLARAAVESAGGTIWSRTADGRVLGIGIVLPL